MLKEFNLVAATYRKRENDCISELWFFAKEIGDRRLEASKTGLPSLIVARTSIDPEEFAANAREAILKNPWTFRYLLKLVPIHTVVNAELGEIAEAAVRLAGEKMRPEDTYKVEARIRLSTLQRDEVIDAIASRLSNKVNLGEPDKVIVVEIIGERAGLSVIPPSLIVSVEKLRRIARRRASQERRGL